MFLKTAALFLAAFGFGLLSSGGVFTVFVSVGLVPRFADKTHTAAYIRRYEDWIVAGSILGCLLGIYSEGIAAFADRLAGRWPLWTIAAKGLLGVYGLFAGMFVGCFAIAIAEMLNAIPVFARRISLGKGIGLVILSIALGKTVGSTIYFTLLK